MLPKGEKGGEAEWTLGKKVECIGCVICLEVSWISRPLFAVTLPQPVAVPKGAVSGRPSGPTEISKAHRTLPCHAPACNPLTLPGDHPWIGQEVKGVPQAHQEGPAVRAAHAAPAL